MRHGLTVAINAISVIGVMLWSSGPLLATGTPELTPRAPLPKPDSVVRPRAPSQLTVKFQDPLRLRAELSGLVSEAGAVPAAVSQVVDLYDLELEPLIRLPRATLRFVEARAEERSGNAQPDLAGMMVVRGPYEMLETAAQELLLLDEVEWVEFQQLTPEPPCSDIAPTTPSYYQQGLQGYLDPDPGVNAPHAWSLGARGQGVKIADCEYGYIAGTEDLCSIIDEPGQTIDPGVINNGWHNHGTAVLGEMIGLDNAYGVTGISPDASGMFFTEWSAEEGFRRVTAITNAIASVDPGDIVVLEMQTAGAGGGYGPAELDLSVWNVVKAGTDGGVIVIGAAGNGNQDLDSAAYASYLARGDSGAIIVGAGSANTSHNKLSFSTHGSRVDVQGWGESVFTLGYGSYAELGGDDRQRYTSGFNGTSSATPIVSGSAAAIQSYAQTTLGCTMEPDAMRQLLIDTGVPQGSGGEIGPFPDLQAALDTLAGYPLACDYGCGNGIVDVSEQCDGAQNEGCGGPCSAGCTCAPLSPGAATDLLVTGYEQATDQIYLDWTPACQSSDHALVYGPIGSVQSYSYVGQVCGIGDAGSVGPLTLGSGSFFFLTVGNDGQSEGSYGRDSSEVERPEQTTDPDCTLVQDLSAPCS